MRKLYIVKFRYQDTYERNTTNDEWILACEDTHEVHAIMKKIFSEMKRYGHEGIGYSFREISETNNGFKVSIEKARDTV